MYGSSNVHTLNLEDLRECSIEKCWGGAENWGGHPNSVQDLEGAM